MQSWPLAHLCQQTLEVMQSSGKDPPGPKGVEADIAEVTPCQRQDPPDGITIDQMINDPKLQEYMAMLSTVQDQHDDIPCEEHDDHLEKDDLRYHDPGDEENEYIGDKFQLTLDLDVVSAVANVLDDGPKLENKFLRTAPNPEMLRKLQPFLAYHPIDVVKWTLECTTRMATMQVQLPLRRHLKARFPFMTRQGCIY